MQEASSGKIGRKVILADQVRWDEEFDDVVGAGAAGFSFALNCNRLGSSVVVLEKAPEAGGTARKSAAWYWILSNSLDRAALGLFALLRGRL